MHREAREFVRSVFASHPQFFDGKEVLEVGALDVNGSVRHLFTNCTFFGIDVTAGPGVDEVSTAHEFAERCGRTYDVVLSTEMLEHDPFWRKSLLAMYELTKPGGLMLFTCATTGRPPHGFGGEDGDCFGPEKGYYRNVTVSDLKEALLDTSEFTQKAIVVHADSHDLYFSGIKAS